MKIEKQEDCNTERAWPSPQTFTERQEGISKDDVIVRYVIIFIFIFILGNASLHVSVIEQTMSPDTKEQRLVYVTSDMVICGYSVS